jgi:hypothetical protein
MSRQTKNPPAYVAHRGVFMFVIAVVVVLIGLALASAVPGVLAFVRDGVAGLHDTWTRWDWKLF